MVGKRPIIGAFFRNQGTLPVALSQDDIIILDRVDGRGKRSARIPKPALEPGEGLCQRSALDTEYHRPPPEILQLGEADLRALERILSQVRPRESTAKR